MSAGLSGRESDGEAQGVVYLTVPETGGDHRGLLDAIRDTGCPPVWLVTVRTPTWDRDTTPWPAPSIHERGRTYGGQSDAYLDLLVNRLAPRTEALLGARPAWRGIAGHSLAGLLAAYAPFRTDFFTRFASVSGSLWYPGFLDFVATHPLAADLRCGHLSLGSKESHTRNRTTNTVRDRSVAYCDLLRDRGVRVDFQLTPGGHFGDVPERLARAVSSIAR